MSNDTKALPDPYRERVEKLVKRLQKALRRRESDSQISGWCSRCGVTSADVKFLSKAVDLIPDLVHETRFLLSARTIYQGALDGDPLAMVVLHYIDRNAWKVTGVQNPGLNGASA